MEHSFQRQEPGKWASAIFSFLMHAVLVTALVWGVQWQRRESQPVGVELVRAQPASVPPPPPQPEPEVRPEPPKPQPEPKPVVEKAPEPKPVAKPDIALKEPEKKKPAPKPEPKPEPEKKPEKKPEPKPEKKPEPKPEKKEDAKPPMSDIDRMLMKEDQRIRDVKNRSLLDKQAADLNAKLAAAATAASMGRAQADWISRISQKVRSNLILPPGTSGDPKIVFRLQILPSGEVLGEPKLVSNTGGAALEEAVRRAILKSSPLPKPEKNEVFERELNFNFYPTRND